MELILERPFYVLSKKYYAGGEITIEFVILENKATNANLTITFKNNEEMAELFRLGKEYKLSFTQIEKGEAGGE